MIQTLITKDKNFFIAIDSLSAEDFQTLVQRGANLWPDAPPEIKKFADLITSGEILQDYNAQTGSNTKN